ncbi:MAG TPA: SirB2 family protein [Casimicrobiaceae bacterium]|nr:SirB2 family protein [Casimicrobiaceae bacterium]
MQATYPVLNAVHVGTAALSFCLFAIRGAWMMCSPARLARRWVRVVPHLVDTLLLVSAIALAVVIGNYPGTHAWLTAKVAGLVLYIVLGSIALKRGRTRAVRVAAFFAALGVFAYIVAVAVTKSPMGPLAWIAH